MSWLKKTLAVLRRQDDTRKTLEKAEKQELRLRYERFERLKSVWERLEIEKILNDVRDTIWSGHIVGIRPKYAGDFEGQIYGKIYVHGGVNNLYPTRLTISLFENEDWLEVTLISSLGAKQIKKVPLREAHNLRTILDSFLAESF